ncbi:hypothetical protein CH267_00285 [Rhodococcus sp. 06-621-2]|nr:diguanylate cyclase [Rhodococcus sp. 06-621-2]OZC62830.1 hypothetical protein CH267_00285 [Rhodococcus sp. 06-621-2]
MGTESSSADTPHPQDRCNPQGDANPHDRSHLPTTVEPIAEQQTGPQNSGDRSSAPAGLTASPVDPASHAPDLADRYRVLVEHLPEAVCVHQQGVIVYINPAGLRYLRADSDGVILGRPITDFIAPQSIGPMLARIASLDVHGVASAPSDAVVLALDGTTVEMEAVSVRTLWNGMPAYQVILRDLSEHNMAQEALKYQAALVTHVSDAIIGVASDGTVTSWNPAAALMYGRTESQVSGRPVADAVGAACDPHAILAGGGRLRETHHRPDGTALTVAVSAAQMQDGYVLVCADQTAARRAEEHFTAVVESLEEGVVVLDHTGRIISANHAAKTILDIQIGWTTAGRAESLPFRVFGTDGKPVPPLAHPVADTQRTKAPATSVIGVERRRDGRRFWLSLTATLLTPGNPESDVVATFADITESYRTSVELEHAATHDHLTGLPNRSLLLDRLDTALSRPDRTEHLAVLFIDVDNFKSINDMHGHTVGDGVLGTIAQRLTRALSSPGAFVGRIGGDEFVAVIPTPRGTETSFLRSELAEPIDTGGVIAVVTVSIGAVTVTPGDHRTAQDILRDADLDMYQAKPAAPQNTVHHP